jgi:putative drug exporter of the RND superfamily
MWERISRLVSRRPLAVLGVSLLVLVAPTLALSGLLLSYDIPAELPAESDSVQGIQTLEESFGAGQVQPVVLIVRSEKSIWNDQAFQAIDDLTVNLEKVPGVSGVRSITRPTEGGVSPKRMKSLGLGGLAELTEQLPRAAGGLGRAIDGLALIRQGLERIGASVPSQEAGLQEALDGIASMRDGIARLLDGIDRLQGGLARVEGGLERLADEVAKPTLQALQAAWDDLRDATVARADPQYDDLARHVGTALAAVSGRCPDATGIGPQPADCPAGTKVEPQYDGLRPTLLELAAGIERAVRGLSRASDGLSGLDGGLARLEGGLAVTGPRIDQLEQGVNRMVGGLNRIIPGLERLRKGLALGTSLFEETGLIPEPGEVALTATLVDAFPELRRELSFFVGQDGRATRVYVTLEASPYEPGSLEASRHIREVARLSLRETPLQNAELLSTGAAPFFADIDDVSTSDLPTIIFAVILGIFLVLALLLRSVVAPFYLVATVLLSFASTLGLTVLVFQGILGEEGLVWWLPIFLFVVLVALGADYNIFLMGRIREEATRMETRPAVIAGLSATGHVITSAGLILAGTFAALLAAPLEGMVQMGFAATVGILVDTFIVRSLMVPSIAILVGSGSWWPSARAQEA